MARFVFELEPVLEQRRRVERERQKDVAELERQRLALEGVIRGHQGSIAQERRDLRERVAPGAGPVDLAGVRVQANASLFLIGKAQRVVLELSGVHKRLTVARHKLTEAATARRAMERLRERRYEAWKAEQDRREAAALDEIGVMAAARRSREQQEEVALETGQQARRSARQEAAA